MKLMLAFAGFILLLGILLSGLGVRNLIGSFTKKSGFRRARGQVTGFREQYEEDGPMYRPQVAFEDVRGYRFEFTDEVAHGGKTHDVGDTVTVLYDRKNPQGSATLDRPSSLWLFPVLQIVLGLACLAWGFGLVILTLDE